VCSRCGELRGGVGWSTVALLSWQSLVQMRFRVTDLGSKHMRSFRLWSTCFSAVVMFTSGFSTPDRTNTRACARTYTCVHVYACVFVHAMCGTFNE
jgi:hypothetical protein